MELKAKLYLVSDNDEKFMGIGVLWLLEEIAKENSLRKAAANLNISYTKAYHMVSCLEKSLGQPVLERRKGGQNREGAVLTPFGEQFIALYARFQKEAKARLEDPYQEFSRKLAELMEVQNG